MNPNPSFVDQFKKVVLPLFVARVDGLVSCIGTMFVIARSGRLAIALTARHNIDHFLGIDGRDNARKLNVPGPFREKVPFFVIGPTQSKSRLRYLNCKPFTIVTQTDGRQCVAEVNNWTYLAHDAADLAVLYLAIDEDAGAVFEWQAIIASEGPKFGERVLAVGYPKFEITGQAGALETGLTVGVKTELRAMSAKVTKILDWETDRYVRGPCFYMNVDIPSGMSGGPVFMWPETPSAVCGMVSHSSFPGTKKSVASILYPILATGPEKAHLPGEEPRRASLMELIQRGQIDDISNAPERLRVVGDINAYPPRFVWLHKDGD